MVTDIAKELYKDYRDALERLDEAVNEDISKGDIVIDGTIQRFEFCFELAWKLMRAVLKHSGIDADSPRSAVKEAFRSNLIKDGDAWIDMLEDRNKTSHLYDKKSASVIYDKIRKSHAKTLNGLADDLIPYFK
jgi:nucleotidyltransferase substrate binding protein (TIGR01987 family)